MRKIAGAIGVVSVFAVIIFSVRGNEEAKLREVLARAIKAHGGAENLEKMKARIIKSKGKLIELEYTAQASIQMPKRSNITAESKFGKFVQVINDDKAWIKLGELSRECTEQEMAEMKEQLNATCIANLSVLADKEYKLSPLADEAVEGRPAIGMRVERKGFRDVCLYFDKENSLLLKMQSRIRDPLRGGLEFTAETLYGDYREVDGLMIAFKSTIKYDGKVYNEAEVTEAKAADKLDESVFDKP
ncbi:MAG TPA: hypothetical protein VMG10_18580 [Gemmataceae bacterium]|nr:hypothetical protein [Gemmataceae bacterium]